MHPLTAPFLAAAGLLVLAGVLKLGRPEGTAQALGTQSLPAGRPLVRLLGAAEVAVGILALVQAPLAPVLVALSYAAFTGFVLLALVRGRPLTSCGCFAEPDLPPSRLHVLVTAGFAAGAAAVAAGAPAGVPAILSAPVGTAVPVGAAAVLIGALAYLVLAELPRLGAAAAAVRPGPPQDGPQLFSIASVRSSAP